MDRAVTPDIAAYKSASATVGISILGWTTTDVTQVVLAVCAVIGAICTVWLAVNTNRYKRRVTEAYEKSAQSRDRHPPNPPKL